MEYVIVTKNRLTKYGKIVLAIIIAVVLLVASILIFLSKEKIFQAKKNDNLKVAKKDRINGFGAIEYIVKEKNKGIKSAFAEEKEASKENIDIFIEDETQVNVDSKIDDGQNRIGTETLENEIDNQMAMLIALWRTAIGNGKNQVTAFQEIRKVVQDEQTVSEDDKVQIINDLPQDFEDDEDETS